MGFEYSPQTLQKVKAATDKFKPLATFLKGKTELTDLKGVELLAFILDFNERPYRNFSKKEEVLKRKENAPLLTNKQEEPRISEPTDQKKGTSTTSANQTPNVHIIHPNLQEEPVLISIPKETNKTRIPLKFFKSKNALYGIIAMVLILLIGFCLYQETNEEQCMIWKNTHYEVVNCEQTFSTFMVQNQIIPKNDKLLRNFKKIDVTKKTIFFDRKNDPLLWYSKTRNGIEFFNQPGIHPETGKTLKPVTPYILNKYVFSNP